LDIPNTKQGGAVEDILDGLIEWSRAGRSAAIATLFMVERSGPLDPGAVMAVSEKGEVLGSVSGGCVEPAVYEEAMTVIESGKPRRVTYGIADEQAFEVGLTCGGTVHLHIDPMTSSALELLAKLQEMIHNREPVGLATILSDDRPEVRLLIGPTGILEGSTADPELDRVLAEEVAGMLELGESGLRSFGAHGERRRDDDSVFIRSFSPSPEMYVFGAIDFAAAVTRIGKFLGYRVTVCDAREPFATRARFPEADEVVVEWPHEFLGKARVDSRTAICVLTHDPKFDVPLLKVALRTPATYIGAMGSRKTHAERNERLLEEGITRDDCRRIAGPIGLDIGAQTPQEVAVSIAAEIISARSGGTGKPLSQQSGDLHHSSASLASK
jgi:xanthine dehydrogenase accessory factor